MLKPDIGFESTLNNRDGLPTITIRVTNPATKNSKALAASKSAKDKKHATASGTRNQTVKAGGSKSNAATAVRSTGSKKNLVKKTAGNAEPSKKNATRRNSSKKGQQPKQEPLVLMSYS